MSFRAANYTLRLFVSSSLFLTKSLLSHLSYFRLSSSSFLFAFLLFPAPLMSLVAWAPICFRTTRSLSDWLPVVPAGSPGWLGVYP